ncbi:DMT family transporter [soil metagenome]
MGYKSKAYLFLIIGAVISGIAGPVIKLTLNVLPVEAFLFYRFFISTLLVIFLLPFAKLQIPRKPSVLLRFLLYCFLNATVALGFLFLGAAKTTLLNLSLLTIISPLLTIFAGYILLHERISKKLKIGVLIAFIGSFIILVGPFLATGDNVGKVSGNIFVILSVLASVYCTILVKRLLRSGVDPLTLTNTSFVIGFISFLIIILFNGNFLNTITIIKNLPLQYHFGVLYMAILSGTFAYYIGNLAQRSIDVSKAAPFAYIPAVISSILAIALLHDPIIPEIIIGTIVIFVGVYVAETRRKML